MRAEEETEPLVDAAWQAGLRHFDTAPSYGNGESEKRLGRMLSRYPRDELVLSTKAGREPAPPGALAFDYSTAGVRSSILRSCELLRTDRIDLAFIHDIDPDMHVNFEARFAEAVDQAYGALDRLRAQGIIRAERSADRLHHARRWLHTSAARRASTSAALVRSESRQRDGRGAVQYGYPRDWSDR